MAPGIGSQSRLLGRVLRYDPRMAKGKDKVYYFDVTAMIFFESARRLNSSFEAEGKVTQRNLLAAPFYYLVSHAAELFLKAVIVACGKEIPYKLNHDLMGLVGVVEEAGIEVEYRHKILLEELGAEHKDHTLRYHLVKPHPTIPFKTPTFSATAEDLFEMLIELRLLLRIPLEGRR